ncbi:hypothetical protein ACLOJK_027319 [Asimina triloba]
MYAWIWFHDGKPSPDTGSSETCQSSYVAIYEVGRPAVGTAAAGHRDGTMHELII